MEETSFWPLRQWLKWYNVSIAQNGSNAWKTLHLYFPNVIFFNCRRNYFHSLKKHIFHSALTCNQTWQDTDFIYLCLNGSCLSCVTNHYPCYISLSASSSQLLLCCFDACFTVTQINKKKIWKFGAAALPGAPTARRWCADDNERSAPDWAGPRRWQVRATPDPGWPPETRCKNAML